MVTTIVDQYPKLLRRGYRKEIFIGFICIIMFFVGLAMVCNVSVALEERGAPVCVCGGWVGI